MSEVYYRNCSSWQPFPSWAKFLVSVGREVAAHSEENDLLCIAVSLPTRSFAAALASVGVVAERFTNETGIIRRNEYFAWLIRQKPDTPVVYCHQAKNLSGFIVGCQNGRIGIRHDSKDYRVWWLGVENAEKVIPKDGQLALNGIERTALLHHFVPHMPATASLRISRVDCVVVGQESTLREEVTETPLQIQKGDSSEEATLLEILRVRQFLPSNAAYRTYIWTRPKEKWDDNVSFGQAPFAAVFDGSRMFLRARHAFDHCHWICIFDRTAPDFPAASAELLKSYGLRAADALALNKLEVPPGVELLAFTRRRSR